MKSVQTGKDGNVTRCDARGDTLLQTRVALTRRRSTKSSDFTQASGQRPLDTAEHKPEPFGTKRAQQIQPYNVLRNTPKQLKNLDTILCHLYICLICTSFTSEPELSRLWKT